jgi:hypothetical protein
VSRVKRIFESIFIRGQRTGMTGASASSFEDLNESEFLLLLRNVRELSQERADKIEEYSEMLTDGITLSAAELIAEDSTQLDEKAGATVWVKSLDKDFEDKINAFLQNEFEIEKKAFALALNIVAFGECYVNTFYSDEDFKQSGKKTGSFFEIESPKYVAHLYQYGDPIGYYVFEENRFSSRRVSEMLLSEKDFIHFIADQGLNREKIEVEVQLKGSNLVEKKKYTIRYGTSFLEAARSLYKTKVLLDNILILSRLSRSQFYRIFGIEVGKADSVETQKIIKEVRNAISSQRSVNLEKGTLDSMSSPISTGGNVYIPMRDGVGSVKVDTTGGDVDVRALLDIDHFDNQYFGALKVPKQFLGQAEDMPGGLGDTTLTRLDIRYARTCKRVQTVVKEGVKDLIDWYCSEKNITPPDYEVHMATISTAEDAEAVESEELRLARLDRILELLERLDPEGKNLNRADASKILKFVIEEIYGEPRLYGELFGGEKKSESGPIFERGESL